MSKATGYPLVWPGGVPRNQKPEYSAFKVGLSQAYDELRNELYQHNASNVVISTNAVRNKVNGAIASRQPGIDDTGVAVYFTRKGVDLCFTCDRWVTVQENLRAIHKTLEALRGIERWGSSETADSAFRGYEALPAGGARPWHQVLDCNEGASRVAITKAYRDALYRTHPDKGGSDEAFHEVQDAWKQYQEARPE